MRNFSSVCQESPEQGFLSHLILHKWCKGICVASKASASKAEKASSFWSSSWFQMMVLLSTEARDKSVQKLFLWSGLKGGEEDKHPNLASFSTRRYLGGGKRRALAKERRKKIQAMTGLLLDFQKRTTILNLHHLPQPSPPPSLQIQRNSCCSNSWKSLFVTWNLHPKHSLGYYWVGGLVIVLRKVIFEAWKLFPSLLFFTGKCEDWHE